MIIMIPYRAELTKDAVFALGGWLGWGEGLGAIRWVVPACVVMCLRASLWQ